MGTGSFSKDVSNSWKDCTTKVDDGSVSGAAKAGFSVVALFPCTLIWNICIAPAYLFGGDHIPFLIGGLGILVSIIPMIAVFLITVVPGGIAAGLGAIGRVFKFW